MIREKKIPALVRIPIINAENTIHNRGPSAKEPKSI
jgi:hypothetical protein